MKVTKTYKYKLRLTKAQSVRLNQWVGACRYVYNWSKSLKDDAYEMLGAKLYAYDLKNFLPKLKSSHDWIKDVDSEAMQDVLERLEKAYDKFFNEGAGFPKFTRKYKYNSLTIKSIKIDTHNRFKIPKIGSIKFYNSNPMREGSKLKRATIIKDTNGWHICVVCEVEHQSIPAIENQEVGLDWGVKRFYTLSNGEWEKNPRFFGKYRKQKKRLQRSLSRKTKGSHNWKNVKRQLSRLESKIARRRKDWQHKLSTNLIRKYNGIFVEDLKVKNMTKKAKPKLAEDGKTYLPNNASAKSGLNRSILDTAPSQFLGMLEYKSVWNERLFVKSNPKNSSNECSECGYVSKENRKSQSEFKCMACEHQENADVNAAKNHKSRGYTTLLKQLKATRLRA